MRTLRAWLVTALVSVITGVTTMLLIVLDSGILPVALELLVVFGGVLGLIVSLVELFPSATRLRPIVRRILAAMIVAISTGRAFVAVQRVGFEQARRYGAAVAREVVATRAASGRWPRDLHELPKKSLPPLPRSPFLSRCDGHHCDEVAGYFVTYDASGTGEPRFVVARRESGAIWDWRASMWTPMDRNR